MQQIKVAVAQKSFGTAELIVGSESMLINCPILYKWLNTKTSFAFPNAFLKECQIEVLEHTCKIRMEDMEAEVDKEHFLHVIKKFCFDLVDKSEAYVDVKLANSGPKPNPSLVPSVPNPSPTFSTNNVHVAEVGTVATPTLPKSDGDPFDYEY